jgi:hypothetical protein
MSNDAKPNKENIFYNFKCEKTGPNSAILSLFGKQEDLIAISVTDMSSYVQYIYYLASTANESNNKCKIISAELTRRLRDDSILLTLEILRYDENTTGCDMGQLG